LFSGSELENWTPDDWKPNPSFLLQIQDKKLRNWAREIHGIWKELGRLIKTSVRLQPDLYSVQYVSKPFIVPGGRFRELYYWDTYWINKGLLLSQMHSTVKGMLSNFIELVSNLGYVPNGGRIYYSRSQPPFLIPMFKDYVDATGDQKFLAKSLSMLEKEFQFWMRERRVGVKVGGRTYNLARYNSEKDAPRPESYKCAKIHFTFYIKKFPD
jgi:alpha,alpha-trehalase